MASHHQIMKEPRCGVRRKMEALLFIIACIIALAAAKPEEIPLNKASTIYGDLKQIVHDPGLRQVAIHLRDHRRCDSPSFMVRLSGMSIYLLDLDRHDYKQWNGKHLVYLDGRKNSYYFSYPPIVDAGLHFIEVTVMHCKKFNPQLYTELCLENPHGGSNIVTLPYSFQAECPEQPILSPRWVLNTRQDPSLKPVLLPTRYQALAQDGGYTDLSSEDLTKHAQYDFVDLPPIGETMRRVFAMSNASASPVINICMVGASHARCIADEGERNWNKDFNNTLKFIHIESRFPNQFDISQVDVAECTYAVVGYGQWPFSGRLNYTAGHYGHEMNHVLRTIAAYKGPTQFFVRSMNYNALGGFITTCPPIDHRTPQVVQMANSVMRAVAEKHNVEYIDTNLIMAPVWDIAQDWCHAGAKVFTLEAYWILHKALESSVRLNKPVYLAGMFSFTVPDGSLVRFSNAQTVYLFKDGVMRAFPNGGTFMKMGYDFGDVKVVKDTKSYHFKFGNELPNI